MEPTVDVSVDRTLPSWREPAAVAAGGVAGASTRWAVEAIADIDTAAGSFPWSTMGINVFGCLLIGLFAARLTSAIGQGFVITGALGGFTTMSAFAVEANELGQAGRTDLAVTYAIVSLAAGIAATWIGEHFATQSGAAPP